MTREEREKERYCDYYCFMSLADFTAWQRGTGTETISQKEQ
ncbi:hypothetical protein [Arthrobacter sp. ISL-85]|nr:hypothetical protein [Arthrobacter sp. ISL-85]